MTTLLKELRASIVGTLVLAVVCCGLYPLAVFGLGQLLFRDKANGSLIFDQQGNVRGSRLLGQNFTGEKYFHPRPSSAGNGYDAANSSGSNLGPTSHKLNDAIKANIDTYRKENGLKENQAVPADAVTGSGSGLDPHISPSNARLQAARVAQARGVSVEKVLALIRTNTQAPDLSFLGDPGVNVLTLNLALDSTSVHR
jgi:K+-transporting ATPase ATPase C chain